MTDTLFQGPYARRIRIATDLERKSPSANCAFLQRDWGMDIFLAADTGELTYIGCQESH